MANNDFNFDNYFKKYPNKDGFFGKYGGVYVSDELKQAMKEITDAYFTICKSSKFISELRRIRKEFPTTCGYSQYLEFGKVQKNQQKEPKRN